MIRIRRRSAGQHGQLVAGAGAVVAMLTLSPWHELGLFTFDAAWIALGVRLLAAQAPVRTDVSPVG